MEKPSPMQKEQVWVSYTLWLMMMAIMNAANRIEKNEMDGACGMYGGRERCAQGFGGET